MEFPCPSCGNPVHDNGGISCGVCLDCGIFFHMGSRLRASAPRPGDRMQSQAAKPESSLGDMSEVYYWGS
jgi:hypothetical protein